IENDKMRFVPLILQHDQRLGTDFQWFATTIDMVVVVGRLDEGSGQQRVMALPGARDLCRKHGSPAWIMVIQCNRVGSQEKMIGEWRTVQQQYFFRNDRLWDAALICGSSLIDDAAERPPKGGIADRRGRRYRRQLVTRQRDGKEMDAVNDAPG